MRNLKQISIASLALAAACTFAGCSKQNSAPESKSPGSANAASFNEPSVLTPFGMMPQSKVHFVEEGNSISVVGGRLQKIETATGKIVEDYGPVKRLDDNLNIGKQALAPANSILPAASGWIAYGFWANTDTVKNPITSFTTTWTVPSVPTKQGNQTLFLFNGMQDGLTSSSYIIQPVLQWGSSAAGGGKYWAITNWYVSSANAFYGTLEKVSSGTVLQGVMTETAHTGKLYSYNSSFVGYPAAADINATNIPQAWWNAETLETYSVTNVKTMYPPDVDVAMKSIQILEGSTNAPISWSTAQATKGSALKAVVVSNASPGGEVDIYFRK